MAYSAKTDWKINDTVQPQDMNRIEQGINEAHIYKANNSLSNVNNDVFKTKAKASGVEVPAQSDITYYVSPNGDDSAGTGAIDRPFKTFQKAIDSFPDSNPLGAIYHIVAAAGTYAGFTLRANKHIWISPDDNITIGKISLYNGFVEIHDEVTLNDSIGIYNGATLVMNKVTVNKAAGALTTGVLCQYGGTLIIKDEITIIGFSLGISCFLAQAFISNAVIYNGDTGVSCECGHTLIGNESITTTAAKYVVHNGGRIFAGTETIV